MVSFWETLLFGVAGYKGNPMMKHIELHKTIPLQPLHFSRWLFLWQETVNENFEGTTAREAISRAKNIAALIEYTCSEKLTK